MIKIDTDYILQALGWTLLHSLWQLGLLALLLYLLLSFDAENLPKLRYGLAVATLVLAGVLSISTFGDLYINQIPEQQNSKESTRAGLSLATDLNSYSVAPAPSKPNPASFWTLSDQFTNWINLHTHWLALFWLAGVALLSLRLGGSFWYLHRLKHGTGFALAPFWQTRMQEMAQTLELRLPIKLKASGKVRIPMVIGQLKPVIILPASTLIGLPVDQIEAIIAHELVHLYRRDYWINLLQSWLEILFFFHPAIWWISSVIRAEREKCCDDLAVQVCGNPLTYAKALAQVETVHSSRHQLALAFGSKEGNLLYRVQRILEPDRKANNLSARLASVVLVTLSLLLLFTAGESQKLKHLGEKDSKILAWVENDDFPEIQETASGDNQAEASERASLQFTPRKNSGIQRTDTLPPATKPTLMDSLKTVRLPDSIQSVRLVIIGADTIILAQTSSSLSARHFDFPEDSVLISLKNTAQQLSQFNDEQQFKESLIISLDSIAQTLSSLPQKMALDSVVVQSMAGTLTMTDSVLSPKVFRFAPAVTDTSLEQRLRAMEARLRQQEQVIEMLMKEKRQKMEQLLEQQEQILQQQEEQLQKALRQQQRLLEEQLKQQEKTNDSLLNERLQPLKEKKGLVLWHPRLKALLLDDDFIRFHENCVFRRCDDGLFINRQKINEHTLARYEQWLLSQKMLGNRPGKQFCLSKPST